jgi:hypothetical protein
MSLGLTTTSRVTSPSEFKRNLETLLRKEQDHEDTRIYR